MRSWKGGALAVIITAILLFVYYSHQIINADHLSYGIWGDGYKNYYTLAYYLKYDNGAHFSGMNYPFGENVLFTDNQPAFAWILKELCFVFPGLVNHVHAFIGFAFFFSLLLSAALVYKIFIEFKVDQLNAAVLSVLIVMLSPQIARLSAHYSLGYSFYIPAMLYLLIRFFNADKKAKYFVALLLLNCFFVFVHIYYAAMSAMFVLLVAACYTVLNHKDLKPQLANISFLGIAAVAPFVLLKTFLFLTDHITDRPKAPWGFLETRATIADILLSEYTFTGQFIAKHLPHAHIAYHFEGSGYIGLIAILTLGVSFVAWIISLKKRTRYFDSIYPFNLFIIPAILVLLFAMAFPFCISRFERYYTYMPALIKQFRASGRFNWYFYYNATILTGLLLYQAFRKLKAENTILAYGLLIAAYSIWFIEVNMISNRMGTNFKEVSVELDEVKAANELNSTLLKAGKKASDFQAIIPVPIYSNGSEKLYIESPIIYESMKLSYYTGLPIVCGQLSRTSQKQAFEIANLLSSPFIKKDIISQYNSTKPLLLITPGKDLNYEERYLVSKAQYLFDFENLKYYQLELSAFNDTVQDIKRYVAQNRSVFKKHPGYLSTDSIDNVIVKRFENEPDAHAIFGKGANYSEKEDTRFYDGPLPHAEDSAIYEISYWVYTDSRRAAYPVMNIAITDSTGKELHRFDTNAKFATNTYRDWVRVYLDFTLTNKMNKILVWGVGDYATFDEIMIRPKNTDVITQLDNDSTFIFNNFPIR